MLRLVEQHYQAGSKNPRTVSLMCELVIDGGMAMEQQFDGGHETHYQNSPALVNNFDMGGPSNATMNLKNFNSSGPQYPSSIEVIDRNCEQR